MDEARGNYDLFDSQQYLLKLFSGITIFQNVDAYVNFYSQFPDNSPAMLDYGGGPNLFHLIVGAEKVVRYVHSDFTRNNRDEVDRSDGGRWILGRSTGKKILGDVCRWRAKSTRRY